MMLRPVVKNLLPFGYNAIARNRHFIFGSCSRLWWLKTVTVLGLVAGLLLSIPLWIRTGIFPTVPISSALPLLSSSIEALFFIVVLGLSFASLLSAKPQKYLWGASGIIIIFILFDFIFIQQAHCKSILKQTHQYVDASCVDSSTFPYFPSEIGLH